MLAVKKSWKDWKLFTKNGRQFWAYKSDANSLTAVKQTSISLSEDEKAQMIKDFTFDKCSNPNSGDKVFRHLQIEKGFTSFEGKAKSENLKDRVEHKIRKGFHFFKHLLSDEGHLPGDYGGPMFLMPGLIIASYIAKAPLPEQHQELMKIYINNHQNDDGGWGFHIEGHSTMFGTVMQYVSLRLMGASKEDPTVSKARNWIKTNGGGTSIPSWGKYYLSILNVYDWKGFNSVFPELWLLPKWLPIHPSRYWCHSRMVYLPMAYCYGNKIKAEESDLIISLREEIYTEEYNSIDWAKKRDHCADTDMYTNQTGWLKIMNWFTNTYEKIAPKFLRKKALKYVLEYINAEDIQTKYVNIGPVNQAMNSICIWHAYGKDSEEFKKHYDRWFDYLWLAEDGMKMGGYNGDQLWETAFTVRAMNESSIGKDFPVAMTKMYDFIDYTQIKEENYMQEEFFRQPAKGGWPFSTLEHAWVVSDCTAEGLGACLSMHHQKIGVQKVTDRRLKDAVDLLLGMQNKDGGWATYETTRSFNWLEKLNPSEVFADIMQDYSWVECTSATIQGLLEFKEQFPTYKKGAIEKAVVEGLELILEKQREDGSWYGGWGVCFTYGTMFGIEACARIKGLGIYDDNKLDIIMAKACDFLVHHQKGDGGWGESFESCSKKVYVEAHTSQVINTAWSLLALIAAEYKDPQVIESGIELLLQRQTVEGDWLQENISGVFNFNCMETYSNYRNIFPLWALNRWFGRFSTK